MKYVGIQEHMERLKNKVIPRLLNEPHQEILLDSNKNKMLESGHGQRRNREMMRSWNL